MTNDDFPKIIMEDMLKSKIDPVYKIELFLTRSEAVQVMTLIKDIEKQGAIDIKNGDR